MNCLINKINQNFNYFAKLIYLDSYLNLVTPKCILTQKLNKITTDIIELKKKNEKLIKILKDKFPDIELSGLES